MQTLTTTLETSRKLAEFMPQDGGKMYWDVYMEGTKEQRVKTYNYRPKMYPGEEGRFKTYRAFFTDELLEALPAGTELRKRKEAGEMYGVMITPWPNKNTIAFVNNSPVEACAAMLIYLHDQGLLTNPRKAG